MSEKDQMIEGVRELIEQFEDNGNTLPLVEEVVDLIEGSDWFDKRMASAFQRGVDIGHMEADKDWRRHRD